jgi:hypothetical protein
VIFIVEVVVAPLGTLAVAATGALGGAGAIPRVIVAVPESIEPPAKVVRAVIVN